MTSRQPTAVGVLGTDSVVPIGGTDSVSVSLRTNERTNEEATHLVETPHLPKRARAYGITMTGE